MDSEETQFHSPPDRPLAADRSRRPSAPPTLIPGYEPQRFLGSGAFGEVWVARNTNTGRQVAVKFFAHRAGVDWSQLSREVEKLVLLSADRYIVQVLEVGWDAEPPFYVMEYVPNGSLQDLLDRAGPLSVAEAVEIFREITIGLSHAHGKGVLHCDLKPANVLLDQDHKPRLADFGQSRLSNEQRPALGTLFFMAPEQADLTALPDARWDVYALGAVFYCLLTGSPPYRSSKAVVEIDSANNLDERLKKYQTFIRNAPAPSEHRRIKGVDRPIIEIVDRCLAADPELRYPHVLGVLDALREREHARARRPLQLLGLLGPLLLLLTMGFFGYRAFQATFADSEKMAVAGARQANRFAARGDARNVANELERRFRAIANVAAEPRLRQLLLELMEIPQVQGQLQILADRDVSPQVREETQVEFVFSAERRPLQKFIETVMADKQNQPDVASWFITDDRGTMLAAAFDPQPTNSRIGENFAYRTYFHGGRRDDRVSMHRPLTQAKLSAPFKSTATETYKVAISTPIVTPDKTLGVLVTTLELGNFVRFPATKDQCAFLIDGRDNDFHGMIFLHPLYESLLRPNGIHERLPFDISAKEFRVDVRALMNDEVEYYEDPLGRHEMGTEYRGRWVVGSSPVILERRDARGQLLQEPTGLLLTVERRLSTVTEPVEQLGGEFFREGIAALIVVIAVSLTLWYFVHRMFRDTVPASSVPTEPEDAKPLHARETLEMPAAEYK